MIPATALQRSFSHVPISNTFMSEGAGSLAASIRRGGEAGTQQSERQRSRQLRLLEELIQPQDPDYSADPAVVALAARVLSAIYARVNPLWPEPTFYLAHDAGVEMLWRKNGRELKVHVSAFPESSGHYFKRSGQGEEESWQSGDIDYARLKQALDWVAG